MLHKKKYLLVIHIRLIQFFPVFEAFKLVKVKKHLFIKWGGDIHVMGAVLDQTYSTHHLQLQCRSR